MALRGPLQFDRVGSRLWPLFPTLTSVAQAFLPVPQVTIIAARHAWLTHAFVLLGDNLRQTRTTRRGVPLLTPQLLIPASTSVAQAFLCFSISGVSPLLQQRELDFSPAKKAQDEIVALATGL